MLTGLAVAVLIAAGVPPVVPALVGLAVMRPGWALAVVAAWTALARRRAPAEPVESEVLLAVADELRAGAALPVAVGAAVAGRDGGPYTAVARLVEAGRPAEEIAAGLARALPRLGVLAGATYRIAAGAGAGAAPSFGNLAALAERTEGLDRERRAAAAQARLSAGVVAAMPLLAVPLVGFAGLGPATGAGRALVVVGAVMEAAGLAAVAMLVRRAGAW